MCPLPVCFVCLFLLAFISIWNIKQKGLLTQFMLLVSFYTPWKHKKTRGSLMFSMGGGYKKRWVVWIGTRPVNNIYKTKNYQMKNEKISCFTKISKPYKRLVPTIWSWANLAARFLQYLRLFCGTTCYYSIKN